VILYSEDKEQSIDFDIDQKYKKIMLRASGGADSSILLYMIIDFLIKNKREDTKVYTITVIDPRNARGPSQSVQKIVNWILNKTKFKNFEMTYFNYDFNWDGKYQLDIQNDLITKHNIDLMFSGNSANPLIDVKDLLLDAMPERNKDAPRWKAPTLDTTNNECKCDYYQPFHRVDKRFMLSMFKYYDVMELFNITRSCSKYYSYDSKDLENKETCGECWHCRERKWASLWLNGK
tara:strand:- start:5188 stop:5889 length:702 start_codon:yes stop_codon:yes gene_type:complete